MDLIAYLKKHGISQDEFAKRLGVSQGLVWQWLNGKTGYTNARARQISIETNGEVAPHDMLPHTFPEGFEFPADESREAAA